ncbi:MAG: hypothetical protein ACLFS2_02575 [Halochromatium sp.]|uniref:hypothetical protein n=1 Tax=Halochromatium sp. TaxID=2049430 RepID=UPI00397B7E59
MLKLSSIRFNLLQLRAVRNADHCQGTVSGYVHRGKAQVYGIVDALPLRLSR